MTQEDKLVKEGNELMEKIKKQVKPKMWEGFESKIKEDKGNKQRIEEAIKHCTDALETIHEIEMNTIINNNGLENIKKVIAILNFDEITSNKLQDNVPVFKQFFTDMLELGKNFKKQAELKK